MISDPSTRLACASVALAAALGSVALADVLRAHPHDHDRATHTAMGIDPFGHTRLLPHRDPTPDDSARAERLTRALAVAIAPFADPARAVAAGYRTTSESVPIGGLKHYVDDAEFARERTAFDPARPMALLYRRTAAGLELAGAMYGASYPNTPEALDRRVPIAYGTWHAHTNICRPKRTTRVPAALRDGFGFSGWIANERECLRDGGSFMRVVYGWMVHVYPFERELSARF